MVADNRTKQWAFDFKVNGTVRSLAWTPDSRYLLASGGDSQVYTWDLRASRCRACWNNDGGTPTSSMAVSPPMASSGVVGAGGGREAFTAIGAESGVVNLYSYGAGTAGPDSVRPSPRRAIMSLTTPVETLKFNPDGQILAMVSSVHLCLKPGSHHPAPRRSNPHHPTTYTLTMPYQPRHLNGRRRRCASCISRRALSSATGRPRRLRSRTCSRSTSRRTVASSPSATTKARSFCTGCATTGRSRGEGRSWQGQACGHWLLFWRLRGARK